MLLVRVVALSYPHCPLLPRFSRSESLGSVGGDENRGEAQALGRSGQRHKGFRQPTDDICLAPFSVLVLIFLFMGKMTAPRGLRFHAMTLSVSPT